MDINGSVTLPRVRHKSGNCSYADLIMMAISNSCDKQLTLAEIYDWMATNVPGLEAQRHVHSSKGWKNAVRHTLSINKRFRKIGRLGRPGWWTLEPTKNDMVCNHFSKDINLSTAMVSFEPPEDEPQIFRQRSFSEPHNCLSRKVVGSHNQTRRTSDGSVLSLECKTIKEGQKVSVTLDDGTVGVLSIPDPVILQGARVCDGSTQTEISHTIEQEIQNGKAFVNTPNFQTFLSPFYDSIPSPFSEASYDLEPSQFFDTKFDAYMNNNLALL